MTKPMQGRGEMKNKDMMDDDGRMIPFDPDLRCDICNCLGAYDFMGDYICSKCLAESEPYVEETGSENEK